MARSQVSSKGRAKDFYPWSNDYSVGVRLIDIDHKNLFEIINTLHAGIARGLSTGQLGIAIAGLMRYVDEHFEREENLMRDYGYPGLAQHREVHRDMIRKIYAIRKMQISRPASIDPIKFIGFLEVWLKDHIFAEDLDYVPYLRGEASKTGDGVDEDAQDGDPAESEVKLKVVSVKVPVQSAEILHRCALLLRRDGDEAQAIAEITDPISSMTEEEASEICASLLK